MPLGNFLNGGASYSTRHHTYRVEISWDDVP